MKLINITRSLLLSSVVIFGMVSASEALAGAPMVKQSAPGFYRIMLGDFELTVLSDGTVDLPMDKLLHQATETTMAQLAESFLTAPVESSVNAYLVNTGQKLVLIDSGAGSLFGPTLGKLLQNLKASGYDAAQIDEILITHMHPDHVGGLATEQQRVFPNAVVRASQQDADYWLSQSQMDSADEDSKGFFQGAMASLNPYVSANKFQPFSDNGPIMTGISAVSTPGHTVGHTSYVIESNGQTLWVIGDLIHAAAVQFAHPEVTIDFDTKPKQAQITRQKVFTNLAEGKVMLGATHIQFPGLGHVRKLDDGFSWVPVNYQRIR
ncbi:MAG: glyoxylase-like metal-dependent hydrolase (beta-lactamase superfamily II) [Paraglaciecola sp.]|jgi:glyoxylase-like metal-dependent hydrolase (beta-lactamase superfamily II)